MNYKLPIDVAVYRFRKYGNLAPLAGLLATLPKDGWSQEERARFLEAFSTMIDYCIAVRPRSEIGQPTVAKPPLS